MRRTLIFFYMLLSSALHAYQLQDFFIFDSWEQPFVFWLENQQEVPMDGLTLFFLESQDCQSGYLKTYRTNEQQVLHLKPEQILSLNTRAIYQLIEDLKVEHTQSVLVRFTYQKKHLAEFVGGCEDQGINCCLPISCQKDEKNCVFKTHHRVQPFHFNS